MAPPAGGTAAPTTAAAPDRLQHIDATRLARGRQVFAQNCIVCHSSIQPPERFAEMEKFAKLGEFWDHDPGRWLSDPEYLAWALAAVEKADFWRLNYLSTDYRIPVTLVETNSCRALATNALTGHMWQDFASESFRRMPSVGSICVLQSVPRQGRRRRPSSRRGTRPPRACRAAVAARASTACPRSSRSGPRRRTSTTTASGCSTTTRRSRAGSTAFDDGIRKLLWPSRRLRELELQQRHARAAAQGSRADLADAAGHLPALRQRLRAAPPRHAGADRPRRCAIGCRGSRDPAGSTGPLPSGAAAARRLRPCSGARPGCSRAASATSRSCWPWRWAGSSTS